MIGSDVEHGKINEDKPKEIIRYNDSIEWSLDGVFSWVWGEKNIYTGNKIKCLE